MICQGVAKSDIYIMMPRIRVASCQRQNTMGNGITDHSRKKAFATSWYRPCLYKDIVAYGS
jgi:hypothetical protein